MLDYSKATVFACRCLSLSSVVELISRLSCRMSTRTRGDMAAGSNKAVTAVTTACLFIKTLVRRDWWRRCSAPGRPPPCPTLINSVNSAPCQNIHCRLDVSIFSCPASWSHDILPVSEFIAPTDRCHKSSSISILVAGPTGGRTMVHMLSVGRAAAAGLAISLSHPTAVA